MTTLFKHHQKRSLEDWKNRARIAGTYKEPKKNKSEFKAEPNKDGKKTKLDDMPLTFGDPKDYEHLTKEERKELTKRMMAAHSKNPLLGKMM